LRPLIPEMFMGILQGGIRSAWRGLEGNFQKMMRRA
jgi:hypothetical protein